MTTAVIVYFAINAVIVFLFTLAQMCMIKGKFIAFIFVTISLLLAGIPMGVAYYFINKD